jgi:dephospho-CoA kinase
VKRVILAVTGMPGSGKSTVSQMLSRKLGCPIVSMGEIVRKEVKRRGLPLEPKIIEEVAKRLREERGPNAVAIMTLNDIAKVLEKERCVIVDGLRSMYEVKTFSTVARTCIIAVHSSPWRRLERLLKRGREGDVKSIEEFVLRDRSNLRLGIGEVIALADFMIVNEGEMSQLEREVERIVGEISHGLWKSCGRGRG